VRLDIPQNRSRKESEAFTDRSIYKRFTASQFNEELQDKSCHEDQNESSPKNQISFTHHHLIIEKYEFEREGLLRKIIELEEKTARLE
jgi:hypothetical protein